MRLLVTGATGFLGGFVVAESLRRGHKVRAVVRPGTPIDDLPAFRRSDVELARIDLRARGGLVEAVTGVDAVLHLAASKAGDMYAQYAGTVVATENLLGAMASAPNGPRRIIGISSFSVYDYINMWSWSRLDEDSPLAPQFPPRDEYCHTKLVQEFLIREAAQRHGWDWAILRPGVIFGPDNLWTARLGMSATPRRWMRIGWFSRLPVTYVENCAEAILLAAERPGSLALTVNVVDDECPTQSRYVRGVLQRMNPRPRSVTIPWLVVRATARCASLVNLALFRGRAKLPSILVPARLHARFKPLRYSNKRLHEALGWTQRYPLSEALNRSMGLGGETARPIAPAAIPSSLYPSESST